MARKKLTEFSAKKLLFDRLGENYEGIAVNGNDKDSLEKIKLFEKKESFVIKVDEGIKKRAKQGLIAVNVQHDTVITYLKNFVKKGYSQFLIEPFIPHSVSEEKYLSIERIREGMLVRYSPKGGIDIEEHIDLVKSELFTSSSKILEKQIKEISAALGLSIEFIRKLLAFCDDQYISFLEINPLVVHNTQAFILDLAVEVDSAGEFFIKNGWSKKDFVMESKSAKTPEELRVIQLKENSQASLTLNVLHPNGSLFTLLSGGGASITLADEAYNRGFGKELANYADYSGNPNQEETYLYTKQLLSLLNKSKARKKALLIAGGVANFTNIRTTFRGILQALKENVGTLQKQKVKVFVRRPGPNQKEGLQIMADFLRENDLYGGVWDEHLVLTDSIMKALEYIES